VGGHDDRGVQLAPHDVVVAHARLRGVWPGRPGDRHLLGRLGLAEFTLWGGHYYLGGPGGHHLTNLLLHLGSTLLLFLALKRMTGSLWPSAAVAALFAIHPLHVESVAWIAERKDALSGFFWMLTLWLYARYVERPSLGRYAMVFVSLLLGLAPSRCS